MTLERSRVTDTVHVARGTRWSVAMGNIGIRTHELTHGSNGSFVRNRPRNAFYKRLKTSKLTGTRKKNTEAITEKNQTSYVLKILRKKHIEIQTNPPDILEKKREKKRKSDARRNMEKERKETEEQEQDQGKFDVGK